MLLYILFFPFLRGTVSELSLARICQVGLSIRNSCLDNYESPELISKPLPSYLDGHCADTQLLMTDTFFFCRTWVQVQGWEGKFLSSTEGKQFLISSVLMHGILLQSLLNTYRRCHMQVDGGVIRFKLKNAGEYPHVSSNKSFFAMVSQTEQ
jgi:hypothetical protein